MDVLLIMIGFITAIVALVLSVLSIINGTSKFWPIVLLVVAFSLVKIGREINRKKK